MSSFGEIRSAAGTGSEDEFVEALIASLPPIYEKEQKDTILRKVYQALAKELAKADIKLESVANNNYVSIPVNDELLVRSSGTSDRLKNENAFELDQIRLSLPGASITQNTRLTKGENKVQLFFIPEPDIDFIISDAQDSTGSPLSLPTSFDSVTNTLTVLSNRIGTFTVTYKDTGNVVRLSENIFVPEGLFRLGWNEGGFGELGFGE